MSAIDDEMPPWPEMQHPADSVVHVDASRAGPTPPHSLEAEREVLAAVLVNSTALAPVLELAPHEFYFERHQHIRVALGSLHERGIPIDPVTLHQALKDAGKYERIGGARAIGELLDRAGTVANVEHYCATVRRKAAARAMIDTARAIEVAGYQGAADDDTETYLASSQESVRVAVEGFGPIAKPKTRVEILADYAERVRNPEQSPRIRTSIERLDRHCNGGLRRGWLVILQAAAKVGKSSLVTNGIAPAAMSDGLAAHIVTLEMSPDETIARWIARETDGHVPTGVQERGDLTASQWGRFAEAQDRVAGWRWSFDERASSLDLIAASARRQKRTDGLDLLIVDGLTQVSNGLANRTEDIDTTTRGLRRLAVELDAVVCLCVHVDKDAAVMGRPGLYAARGSSSVANDCNLLLVPFRDPQDDRAGLKIFGRSVKQAEWEMGSLTFNGARMAFEEVM